MHRKQHPSDSNKFKKKRHLRAKHQWEANKDLIQSAMNTEQTIFDFMNKMKSIQEAANVKPYPAQALGRKRNMFLKALALDDDKFMEWVQNRLYRLAYDNNRSMTDFTPKDIALGFQKWEGILRNGDPGFGQYDNQFKAFTDRFLKAATSILTNATAGQGTEGTKPNEAPSMTPAGEPVSPTMLDYNISGGGGGQPVQQGDQPQPEMDQQDPQMMGPTPEEEMFINALQEMQQSLSMKDKEFNSYIEDILMEHGMDPMTTNPIEVEQFLDEQFQQILDSVPEGSPYNQNEQELEALYKQYKQKFLMAFEKMQGTISSKLDKADMVAAKRTEKIKKDASLFEVGIVSSSAFATETPLEQTGLSELEIKKLQKDQVTYSASKRIVTNLFSTHPRLEKAKPYWMGRQTNPSELSAEWTGTDGSSITDILFDFGDKRVKFRNDKLVSCGKDDRNDTCTSKIKVAVRINDMNVVPKNPKETKAVFDQVINFLFSRDYALDSDSLLYQRIIADGVSPEQASGISQFIVMKTQQLKEQFLQIINSPNFSKEIKPLLKEVAVFVQELTQELPGFRKEFIYTALSGYGKFKEGSDREANFILSSDETGDRIVFRPLDRDLAGLLAQDTQLVFSVLPIKNTSKDPLIKHYTDVGLTKQEAEVKIEEEYPYRLHKFVKATQIALETSMMMDPRMAGTILPESSVLYSFLKNIRTLKEQEEPQSLPIDDETTQYINACMEYCFSSLTNMIKFFGIEFGDVASTDFNLYNLLYNEQPYDMVSALNNRVDMNNQLGDEINQDRLENGVQNKWFEYKQKERPTV